MKPKKYDWKDSNLALFGSDVEKNVKGFYYFHLLLLKLKKDDKRLKFD